jgi:hypothetical protein
MDIQTLSKNSIDACLQCLTDCERCITECLAADNKDCIAICRDCADICALCTRFEARGSAYSKQLHALCAAICTWNVAEYVRKAANIVLLAVKN